MLRRIAEWIAKERSGLRNPQPWLKEVFGAEQSWAGPEVTPESSLNSSTVAACTRLLSESVASLPLHVYRRGELGKLKAPQHPLYSILHDRPNPYMTSYTWRAQAVAHVLLMGNAYSLIERDTAGNVTALWPLDPRAVTVESRGGELAYTAWLNGQRQEFRWGDVLHLKGPTLDGITGLSIIRMARQGIGLDMALLQHGASTFKNGARPGVVVKMDHAGGLQMMEQLREHFDKFYATAQQAGRTMILPGGLSVEQLGMTSDDAQFLQSRQFSVQEICRWFRVPPHMVGDPTRLAYASSEAEMLAFLQHTLAPWLTNFETEMTLRLLPWRTQFFCEFDANGIARGDQASRYESYSKGLAAGFLTVADVRAWENLPFIPGTDRLLTPANMTDRTQEGGRDAINA